MTAANAPITWRQRLRRILYFFPFQLLMLHLKKNHFLLFFWVLLFGFTMRWIGAKYGIDHQFLYPEYRGETGFISFTMFGFALGGFILSFNLYTYILHGFRFPFIATLSRPFLKFSINNMILPIAYIALYLWKSIDYQLNRELLSAGEIVINLAGFFFGGVLFWGVSTVYFILTNTTASHIKHKKNVKDVEKDNLVKSPIHRKYKWYEPQKGRYQWHVETYLSTIYRIALARKSLHYPKSVLEKVFAQNHVNASLFEIILLISFIVIGSFRENPFFVIPAGASVVLFFTMALM
ncbi:MAG: hypothetical protein HKN32_02140, partial [Flavobacteriales bacterium]|nr:hypothetical protein [Flavobacteriales bacterium]